MAFDYQICRELFLNAIHAVLETDGDYITSIERTARGDLPISGLSLEIYPWHEYCTLSIRLSSDKNCYNPADWQHFEFASSTSDQISQLCAVAEYAAEVYVPLLEEQPSKARDLAHLIFLAGAEALLNESVARRLRAFGIDAPTISNRLQESHVFEYMVFDSDETIRANYCEILNAIWVANRLLQDEVV